MAKLSFDLPDSNFLVEVNFYLCPVSCSESAKPEFVRRVYCTVEAGSVVTILPSFGALD